MLLEDLYEAAVGKKRASAAMSTIISYIEKKMGFKLRKLGIEQYKNSNDAGFGMRYVEDGTTNCIRFNWAVGKSAEIESVDLWNGTKHDPNFHISFKGTSLAQSLPTLVKILKKPKIGSHPNVPEEALTEAKLGTKEPFTDYKQWKAALPKGCTFNGHELERAQCITKDFEGVAGEFNHDKGQGWIYSYHLDKKNLQEGLVTWEIDYDTEGGKEGTCTVRASKMSEAYKEAEEMLERKGIKVVAITNVRKLEESLNEAKKGEFTPESAIQDMIEKMESGRTFNRSEFVMAYHPENSWAFDEFVERHKDSLVVNGKRYGIAKGDKINAKGSKGSKTGADGEVIVAKGGTGEEYEVEIPEVDRITFSESIEHLEGLATALIRGSTNALFVAGRGGTGKTQTIEDTLEANGLADGNGYFKITGSASPIGIYTALYKNRTGIVMFDDCDGALESQDGRNIIKAATDTKKIRKIAWGKKSAGMFDPEDEPAKGEDAEGEDGLDDDDDRIPRHFQFTGRVIFISNLPLNKLDPDGALRTRAFIISIDPTPEEMFERMGEILHKIPLEAGSLSPKERDKVLAVVKTSRRAKDASLRTLVRALNLASSGAPNWEKLVMLYA
jgi:hypothetical protein